MPSLQVVRQIPSSKPLALRKTKAAGMNYFPQVQEYSILTAVIQVLLTRSSVLSDKLELYTKRLIATHVKDAQSTADDDEDPPKSVAHDGREVNDTVFSIEDKDFPLVCSFDYFMQLLENTAKCVPTKAMCI